MEQVNKLEKWFNGRLPREYTDFFLFSNGAYAVLPVQPWCCELIKIEDLIQANEDYGISKAFPSKIAIASSGGGELLVLEIDSFPNKIEALRAIYSADGTDEFLFIADSFSEFVSMLGDEGEES